MDAVQILIDRYADRPGFHPINDEEYLSLLAVAFEELDDIPGESTVKLLSEQTGRPAATIDGHLRRARDCGFLGAGKGAKATAKALDLLGVSK